MTVSTTTVILVALVVVWGLYLFRRSTHFPPPLLETMVPTGSLEHGKAGTDGPEVLLECDYPLRTPPALSNLTNGNLWHYRPTPPINAMESNNIRYWETPNNGGCIPADMCGALYADKTLHIPPPPPMLGWGHEIRVNYYAADGT